MMLDKITLSKVFIFLFLLCAFSCAREDDDLADAIAEPSDYCRVLINGEFEEVDLDVDPVFIDNGREGLLAATFGVIKYPAIARENRTQGTVIILYEITENGFVENIDIIQDIGDGCGEETKRTLLIVTEGESFSSGMLDGVPRRVQKSFSVKFKLQ